ncbi:hypothetical protein ED312_13810 [Sinomicrobium pectinilyticum]|uniref:Uncharacterized protein n=1 Tax=Sinomicrobium pectinilyticum TaxID=1084421 RepID=A0A3N0E9M8_SINP1|nr:hypothetical protein [Sinomicrobium pectinilyticum]RNL84500.1 hypothetical protein ED312_13810 [Sinomicrobium pectinilyticum]
MGHDNLERKIKQKLEKRRIEPSADAWSRLEEKLEKAPASRRPGNGPAYWIAASVIVMLFVGIWISRNGYVQQHIPVITDVRVEKEHPGEKRETIVADSEKEDKIPVEKTKPAESADKKEPYPLNSPEKKAIPFPVEEKGSGTLASHEVEQAGDFEDRKVEEVVSRIMEIHEKREVTDEEIELLLAEAQREIDSQRIIIKQTGTVDAMALLEEVETELDQSFRDKVFEALKEGFVKVKTAVANRNQ